MLAHIYTVIARLCRELGCENGYRVVTNVGADGGQSVPHLHFHVLAKRSLAWPPAERHRPYCVLNQKGRNL